MPIDRDIFSPATPFLTVAFLPLFYLSDFLSYYIIHNDMFQYLSNYQI